MALHNKSTDFAEAKGAPREHSLFVPAYGATEAEAAGAEAAEAYATEHTTTVLRDPNPVKWTKFWTDAPKPREEKGAPNFALTRQSQEKKKADQILLLR